MNQNYNSPTYLYFIFVIASIFLVFVFGIYILHFIINGELINNAKDLQNTWAQFGDYVGGFLSPILAFLALIALLCSIHIQTRELNHSVEQLSKSAEALNNQNKLIQKQNFEETFFQMLKLYNEIVQTIAITEQINTVPTKIEGRDALAHMYGIFTTRYLNNNNKIDKSDPEKDKREKYAKFYRTHGGKFGHYYRIIYNILKFIGNSDLAYKEQKFYADILRAQLSEHELVLFFYNLFYFEGNGKGKMYKWVEQYNILKHIEREVIPESDHPKLDQVIQAYKVHRHSMNISHKSKTV
ncbi:MAG: putative phage abortive infection protein [Proteobacteria bacterium]|nr:putative phage abortive infection protein [Pseudomonadota bacterium]